MFFQHQCLHILTKEGWREGGKKERRERETENSPNRNNQNQASPSLLLKKKKNTEGFVLVAIFTLYVGRSGDLAKSGVIDYIVERMEYFNKLIRPYTVPSSYFYS